MRAGDVARDLLFALRALRKSPAHTAVVVMTLALGIGVNTAVFTVVNAVLLRPLPYEESQQLAMIFRTVPQLGFARSVASYPDFSDWRRQSTSFSQMAAYAYHSAAYMGADGAEQWQGYRVTAELFPLLGTTPLLGRTFTAEEDLPGAEHVVLLSHATWRDRFGADPEILGRSLRLGGDEHQVVGVMPPAFDFPTPAASYWVPLRGDVERMERDSNFLTIIGRLAPGIGIARAQEELQRLAGRIDASTRGANEGYGVFVESRHDFVVRDAHAALAVFSVAVGLILAIACANVANIMLVRGVARSNELAVRAALGAGRGRLTALMLGESASLALIGGVLGLVLCHAFVRLLLAVDPSWLPRAAEVAVDPATLAFTMLLALGSGLAFGTAPALLTARANLLHPLEAATASSRPGRVARYARQGFVVTQVALAMVLLVGGARTLFRCAAGQGRGAPRRRSGGTRLRPAAEPSRVLAQRLPRGRGRRR